MPRRDQHQRGAYRPELFDPDHRHRCGGNQVGGQGDTLRKPDHDALRIGIIVRGRGGFMATAVGGTLGFMHPGVQRRAGRHQSQQEHQNGGPGREQAVRSGRLG